MTGLMIDVSRLGRRPGAMRSVHRAIPSPTRIGLDLIGIPAEAPLQLDLQVQSVSEGVLVTGTISAPTTGECARCLTPISGDVEVEITELFAYPDSTTDSTTDSDEVGRVRSAGQADSIDLEQPIVDAVGLALPFSPLCNPDCAGLCPQCGVLLAGLDDQARAEHHHEQIDPRWAKLAALLPDQRADGTEERP